MRILLSGLLALSWLGWSVALADENQWVCVPGEGGRWRCGHDEKALDAIPLEAPKAGSDRPFVPANSPFSKPRMPWTPSDQDIAGRPPQSGNSPRRPAPGKLELVARMSDDFVLRLVSVSTEGDVTEFVDDFDMDPSQVRYTRVTENDNERFLIVYGRYDSEQRAAAAIAALPPAMRAIQPKAMATGNFENPLLGLQKPVAAESDLKSTDDPPEVAAKTENELQAGVETKQHTAPSELAMAETAVPTEPAVELTLDSSAPAITMEDTEQSSKPVLSEQPGAGTDQQPERATEVVTSSPSPAPVLPAPIAVIEASQPPVSEPVPVTEDPEPETPQPAILVADTPKPGLVPPVSRPAPSTTTRPARKVASTPAKSVGKPDKPFADIDSGNFTLQLSSQKSEASTTRFIARHGLDRSRLYLVLIDEGAGPRWLVLYSEFPDLSASEAARSLVPASIRSPWARRVAPLQQNLIDSR